MVLLVVLLHSRESSLLGFGERSAGGRSAKVAEEGEVSEKRGERATRNLPEISFPFDQLLALTDAVALQRGLLDEESVDLRGKGKVSSGTRVIEGRRQRTWPICIVFLSSAYCSEARRRSTSLLRASFSTETEARRLLRMSSWSLSTSVTLGTHILALLSRSSSKVTHDPT